MNVKKTLVLGMILIAGTLYLTKILLPTRESQEQQGLALSRVDKKQIKNILVSRYNEQGGEERFVLKQSLAPKPLDPTETPVSDDSEMVETWSLPSIRGAVLDKIALKDFLNALTGLSVEGPLEKGALSKDISVYGLDKPRMTAIVDIDGKQTEIAFGKRNSYLAKRYVKISGRSGIFLSDEALFEAVNKGSSDLRSKKPFNFSVQDVREFLLTSIQGRIRVTQPEVGSWRIEAPEQLPASTQDVEAVLNAVTGVQVERFIDGEFEERNRYGFGMPRANLIILFRDGVEPHEVSFFLANANQSASGEPEMYMYSSTSETIFKLASDPSDSMVKTVDGLREKQVVKLPYSQIDRLVAGGAKGMGLVIAVKGIEWVVNDKKSDPVFVEQLLKDISGLRAVDFPKDIEGDVFKEPYLVLDLTPKSTDFGPESIVIGDLYSDSRGNALRYAKSSLSDTIYGIRDVEAKRIVPHEEALVERTLAPADTTH